MIGYLLHIWRIILSALRIIKVYQAGKKMMEDVKNMFRSLPKGLRIMWIVTMSYLAIWFVFLFQLAFTHGIFTLYHFYTYVIWVLLFCFTSFPTLALRAFEPHLKQQ